MKRIRLVCLVCFLCLVHTCSSPVKVGQPGPAFTLYNLQGAPVVSSELTGKVAQDTLESARITVNRNTVPFETRSPFVTSGVRIGTPAVTTRGMKEPEMDIISGFIARALENVGDERVLASIGDEVTDLSKRFPLDLPE